MVAEKIKTKLVKQKLLREKQSADKSLVIKFERESLLHYTKKNSNMTGESNEKSASLKRVKMEQLTKVKKISQNPLLEELLAGVGGTMLD